MTDPSQLVRGLNADAIRDRLDELDRERAALKVLLRAARRVTPGGLPPRRAPALAAGRKGVRS